MTPEQREKLKEKIADIIEMGWHRGAPDSFPSTMAEKILQEVERHEWKKSDGIMEYAGALSKESADKLSKFIDGEKVQ